MTAATKANEGRPTIVSDYTLNRIRSHDVCDLVDVLGLERAKGQRDKYGCVVCPSSDALHVYRKQSSKSGAHCFSCHENFSDCIDLVQKVHALEFVEAVKWLCDALAIPFETADGDSYSPKRPTTGPTPAPKRYEPTPPPNASRRRARIRAILKRLWANFELSGSARQWLEEVKGINPGVAEWVRIKSATPAKWRELVGRLSDTDRRLCGLENSAGKLHPSWSDEFLIIPYWSRDDTRRPEAEGRDPLSLLEVDTLRFRTMRPTGQRDLKFSLCSHDFGGDYIESPQPTRAYLGWWAVEDAQIEGAPLYLVEGETDALSILEHGREAIGVTSNNGLTREHVERWADLRWVVVIEDGDDPSAKLTQDAIAYAIELHGEAWRRRRLRAFQPDDDANEMHQAGELLAYLSQIEHTLRAEQPHE